MNSRTLGLSLAFALVTVACQAQEEDAVKVFNAVEGSVVGLEGFGLKIVGQKAVPGRPSNRS